MARNMMSICYESCTIVYTLLDESVINYEDFNLIIRGLHSFMVEGIESKPELKSVHVKLGYQASLKTAERKLGTLASVIGISKLSNYVKESEFSRLEQLKQRFGLPNGSDEQIVNRRPPGRKPTKRPQVFKPRPAPYPKKGKVSAAASVPPTPRVETATNGFYQSYATEEISDSDDATDETYPDAQQFA